MVLTLRGRVLALHHLNVKFDMSEQNSPSLLWYRRDLTAERSSRPCPLLCRSGRPVIPRRFIKDYHGRDALGRCAEMAARLGSGRLPQSGEISGQSFAARRRCAGRVADPPSRKQARVAVYLCGWYDPASFTA